MSCPIKLTASESCVYAALIQAARDGGPCPTNGEIGAECGYTASHVESILTKLKGKGVVTSERRGNGRTLHLPLLGYKLVSEPNASHPITLKRLDAFCAVDANERMVAACERLFERRAREIGCDVDLARRFVLHPLPARASSPNTPPPNGAPVAVGGRHSVASAGLGAS